MYCRWPLSAVQSAAGVLMEAVGVMGSPPLSHLTAAAAAHMTDPSAHTGSAPGRSAFLCRSALQTSERSTHPVPLPAHLLNTRLVKNTRLLNSTRKQISPFVESKLTNKALLFKACSRLFREDIWRFCGISILPSDMTTQSGSFTCDSETYDHRCQTAERIEEREREKNKALDAFSKSLILLSVFLSCTARVHSQMKLLWAVVGLRSFWLRPEASFQSQ